MILGLDFETNGLDTNACQIMEIGAVLWCEKTHRPISMMSRLIKEAVVTEESLACNGILQSDIDLIGMPLEYAHKELELFVERVSHVVAHNGTGFDRPIYNRHGWDKSKPWIDTSVDVPYPSHIATRKLVHLAAEHGFVNPFPHRAVTDVLTMMRVLSKYDFAPIAEMATQPSVTVAAMVSFEDKEKARARGYRWDPKDRRWVKSLRLPQLAQEIAEAGFPVRQIACAS